MHRKYTRELFEGIVPHCISIAGVLRRLNLKISGGNYSHIKSMITLFGVDTSHFKGQGSNRGRHSFNRFTKESFTEKWLRKLDRNVSVNTHKIKLYLVSFKIKEARCNNCGGDTWMGGIIPLELHHIDGDRWNNEIDNVELLCPNCHALTSNNSGKKNKKVKVRRERCVHRNCRPRYGSGRKVERPPYAVLITEVSSLGFCAVARKYGVSDNAIRKWIRMYLKYETPQ